MNKLRVSLAALLFAFAVPAAAQESHRTPIGQLVPDTRELDLQTLRDLIQAAESSGNKTVFIGGPIWSLMQPKNQPKNGIYLLDDGSMTRVAN